MTLPSGDQVEIEQGDQRVVVVEVGGGLRTYEAGGRAVLDAYGPNEMSRSGRGQVLIPWPNRLQDGSYEFGGKRNQVPLNEVDQRNAIHGLVRWASWSVREREAHRAVMGHVLHPQPGYPFTLDLSIEYRLSDDGLTVTTTATNVGAEACPYGAGAHPYLTLGTERVDELVLSVPGRTVLVEDERGIPVGRSPVDGSEHDFRRPRPIGSTELDHCFTDLDFGEERVARAALQRRDGTAELTVWVDESYPFLMLFTGDPLPDVNRRSIAIEPMTCPPNAFRSGEALIALEPGESHSGTWGISPKIAPI